MNRLTLRRARRGRASRSPRPCVECLEQRHLPSAVLLVPQPVPNETADQAASASLGDLTVTPVVEGQGSIGTGPDGAADIAWYQFTLDSPADVRLTLGGQAGAAPFAGTL